MTSFAKSLANFERYLAHAEPRVYPQASTIIANTYGRRAGSGLGDAVSDLLASDPSVTDPAAANATTNALAAFFGTVGGLLNQPQQTQAQLQQLEYQAQAQQYQAQAAAANNSTMLLVGGVVVAVIGLALVTKRR